MTATEVAEAIVRELWLHVPRDKASWESAIWSVESQITAFVAEQMAARRSEKPLTGLNDLRYEE